MPADQASKDAENRLLRVHDSPSWAAGDDDAFFGTFDLEAMVKEAGGVQYGPARRPVRHSAAGTDWLVVCVSCARSPLRAR